MSDDKYQRAERRGLVLKLALELPEDVTDAVRERWVKTVEHDFMELYGKSVQVVSDDLSEERRRFADIIRMTFADNRLPEVMGTILGAAGVLVVAIDDRGGVRMAAGSDQDNRAVTAELNAIADEIVSKHQMKEEKT